MLLLCLAPNASATVPDFIAQSPEDGKSGAAAGRMELPRGIAANPNLPGHVYVANDNERIDEFTVWGEFVRAWGWGVKDGGNEFQACTDETGCKEGIPGSGAGQFNVPEAIATDSAGNVYVMEAENHRVQKFDSEGNFLLMFGGEVNETTKANVCTKADLEGGNVCKVGKAGSGAGEFQFGVTLYTSRITTSPTTGTVFVAEREKRIQAFNPNGSFKEEIKGGCLEGNVIRVLASDSAGDLYVFFAGGKEVRKLKPTGPAGQCVAEPIFKVERVFSMAVGPEGHLFADVEAGEGEPPRILEFDASGACLNCGEKGEGGKPGFDRSPNSDIRAITVGDACGPADVYVTHFQPSAPSEAFFSIWGDPPNVEIAGCEPPKRAPEITSQYALSAEATEATLQATINPKFWPDTRYYLEYGTAPCSSGGCTTKQPLPPGSLLTTKTTKTPLKTAAIVLEGLAPERTYFYRFVAESEGGGPVWGIDPDGPEGSEEASEAEGEEASFTTFSKIEITPCPINEQFRTGASALLPDCRAYELVSPLEKGSGDIIALPEFQTELPSTLDQSSTSGEKMAYGTYRSFGDAESAPFTTQYVAKRGADGWASHAISPPRGRGTVHVGQQIDTELKALSPDLCSSWWRQLAETEPPLDPAAVPNYPNLYLREDGECGASAYEALTTVKPPNLPSQEYTGLELQGRSADGTATIYVAADSLEGSGAPPQPAVCSEEATSVSCRLKLYYRGAGEAVPHYACVLPDGAAFTGGCSAGTSEQSVGRDRMANLQGALSEDGSRIFWTAAGSGTAPIYARQNPGAEETGEKEGGACVPSPELACTIAVSKAGEELSGTTSSRFWAAAVDGSRVIFTSASDVYSFEVDTQTTTKIAGKSSGVVGVSADAKRVYLVSQEACGGAGEAGQLNLYLYEAGEECATGEMAFVAALAGADLNPTPPHGAYSTSALEPGRRWTRVTPNGLGLAFGSFGTPTGYDNTDQKTGEADAEVYLYDAVAEELHCASCNPSGARPVGIDTVPGAATEFWVAGMIGGWQNNLYAGRELSDDGNRLYFESSDALTPRDTNGLTDVYQWEAVGAGGCDEASSSFAPNNGGCVDLVSSGQAAQAARFHDASPSGDDVFFSTLESLLGQDFGLIDIYDARVEGGFPEPPPPPVGCEGESCQHPPAAPPFVSPSSGIYDGPGNLSEKPKACPKGKVKKNGKCVKKKKGKAKKKRHARHSGRAVR